jgi:hypothetical protein
MTPHNPAICRFAGYCGVMFSTLKRVNQKKEGVPAKFPRSPKHDPAQPRNPKFRAIDYHRTLDPAKGHRGHPAPRKAPTAAMDSTTPATTNPGRQRAS